MLWTDQSLVLEADGRVKYRDDGRSLWQEKRRQEHLERLGYRVIRVLWSDVEARPDETAARVRAVLQQSH
jgi:very-short-patch-repair endonuclease